MVATFTNSDVLNYFSADLVVEKVDLILIVADVDNFLHTLDAATNVFR